MTNQFSSSQRLLLFVFLDRNLNSLLIFITKLVIDRLDSGDLVVFKDNHDHRLRYFPAFFEDDLLSHWGFDALALPLCIATVREPGRLECIIIFFLS